MPILLREVRKAMKSSGLTNYRIWKDTGITQGQLSRFARGERGMSVENIERMAEYLGLEIVIRPKRRSKKGK